MAQVSPDSPFYYFYDPAVELEDPQPSSGGGLGSSNGNSNGVNLSKFFSKTDSLGNNPNDYSSIGPRQGSVLPAGDQGSSATTYPINFNDSGITTTTFDGSGAQLGDTTTSSGTGGSSSDSGGSWLGAVIGGLRGYKAGKENYENDPAMTSGEDGFGKYHHDARAEVGGGIGGAYLGWLGASPISDKAVEWSHPIMQDATRDVINFGDKAGDAYGAMSLDPIGTIASGKYSKDDLTKSAFFGPLARYFD